jgi:hypothetical protein
MIRTTYFCDILYHAVNIRELNLEYHFDLLYQDNWDDLHKHDKEMIDWCAEEFGETGTYWSTPPYVNSRWIVNSGEIWFKDELDLFAFVLRWS